MDVNDLPTGNAEPQSRSEPDADQGFSALKLLLVEPEQRRLQQLEDVVLDPSAHIRHVGRHLSEALYVAAQDRTPLVEALRDPALESLAVSAQHERERVANALAPVIGPAIQRAIVEALQSVLQSIDQVTQRSFSMDGLRWRWEAWRTGVSFQQVVLNHTLRYAVEQLYLIQKPTGLLAAHLVHSDINVKGVDKDAVAGMLMAIQSFVRDSAFADSSERVETIELHGKTVWLCHGPWALLAVVIRGMPPIQLRMQLQRAIDTVHTRFHHALRDYTGDATELKGLEAALTPLLQKELVEQARAVKRRPGFVSMATVAALLGALGYTGYLAYQRHQEEMRLRTALTAFPGTVVTDVRLDGPVWRVNGLIDPLVRDESSIADRAQLPAARLRLEMIPYVSLDHDLSLRRIVAALQPPSGVDVRIDGQKVLVSGNAPESWIREVQLLSRLMPHGDSIDSSKLNIATDVLTETSTAINRLKLYFKEGTTLRDDSVPKVTELVELMQRLQSAATLAHKSVQLVITGQVDGIGPETSNKELKLQRAMAVKLQLTQAGISEAIITIAEGSGSVSGLLPEQRRVDLQATLAPEP